MLPRGISNSDYNRVDLTTSPKATRSAISLRRAWTTTSPRNHHLSFVYNYDKYASTPDFLNNVVAAFPGTGVMLGSTTQTGQHSNRFAGTLSLRSQFGSRVTNEWRGGLNGGTILFFPDVNPGPARHLAGYRPIFNNTAARRTFPV